MFESEEWNNLVELSTRRKRDFAAICFALYEFISKSRVSPDEIEIELRKIDGCKLFLFAENPCVARYNRNHTPVSPDGKPVKYNLALSTKQSREIACNDFETGCRDEKENLNRLKDAGFASIDRTDSASGAKDFINRVIEMETGQVKIMDAEFLVELEKFLNSDEEYRQKFLKLKCSVIYVSEVGIESNLRDLIRK
jgi:hypothetical protein